MIQGNKKEGTENVTKQKSSWIHSELEGVTTGQISAPDITAGSWKGSFNKP